jgi:hypothetical protein
MQRRSNRAIQTIERLRFLRVPCKVAIKKISVERTESSFETAECGDMSLRAGELD